MNIKINDNLLCVKIYIILYVCFICIKCCYFVKIFCFTNICHIVERKYFGVAMNIGLVKLYNFLNKEGHFLEAKLLNKIIKKAEVVPAPNQVVRDVLMLNSAGPSAISLVSLGSEVEYRYGRDGVAKLTTIDFLKDGSVLCMGWDSKASSALSEYSLEEALKSYPGISEEEKLLEFFEKNRSMAAFGNYNQFIGSLFGGSDARISNETIASKSKRLYIIPPKFKVNIIGDMVIDGVTIGDLVDFATDIASVGLSLGAAFFSGGASLGINIAAKLRSAAGIANAINIYNNLFNKRFLEAIVSILALGLNIRNTKPLIKFYKKYINKVGSIRLSIPQYFLDILSALLSSITLIGDQFSGIVDEIIKEKLKALFSKEMSEDEIRKKLEEMASAGSEDTFIIFANDYYKKDGAGILKEAADNLGSEIRSFIEA